MTWFRREARRQALLAQLAEQLRLDPERIRATTAWRRFDGSADSLDVVALVMDLEDELAGRGGAR